MFAFQKYVPKQRLSGRSRISLHPVSSIKTGFPAGGLHIPIVFYLIFNYINHFYMFLKGIVIFLRKIFKIKSHAIPDGINMTLFTAPFQPETAVASTLTAKNDTIADQTHNTENCPDKRTHHPEAIQNPGT